MYLQVLHNTWSNDQLKINNPNFNSRIKIILYCRINGLAQSEMRQGRSSTAKGVPFNDFLSPSPR